MLLVALDATIVSNRAAHDRWRPRRCQPRLVGGDVLPVLDPLHSSTIIDSIRRPGLDGLAAAATFPAQRHHFLSSTPSSAACPRVWPGSSAPGDSRGSAPVACLSRRRRWSLTSFRCISAARMFQGELGGRHKRYVRRARPRPPPGRPQAGRRHHVLDGDATSSASSPEALALARCPNRNAKTRADSHGAGGHDGDGEQ